MINKELRTDIPIPYSEDGIKKYGDVYDFIQRHQYVMEETLETAFRGTNFQTILQMLLNRGLVWRIPKTIITEKPFLIFFKRQDKNTVYQYQINPSIKSLTYVQLIEKYFISFVRQAKKQREQAAINRMAYNDWWNSLSTSEQEMIKMNQQLKRQNQILEEQNRILESQSHSYSTKDPVGEALAWMWLLK